MGTYGFGAQISAGNRVAEDFILADDYDITSFVFYSYQTGAAPPSINNINVQVWDGDPSDPGSSVIWGDDTTNVLSDAVWSGAYRQLESAPGDTSRAIQEVTVDVTGLSLAAGTYWVDYQFGGTGASGPWAPPVVITGQSATGNALQSIGGVWGALVDVGAQGLPINVYGDCTSCGGGGPVTAYGANNALSEFVSWDPAAPDVLNTLGTSPAPNFEGGGCVDPNNPGTAYAMDIGGTFYSIDMATGVYTAMGNVTQPGAETVTGMEIDPVSGTLYLLTTDIFTSTLSTVDLGTLARTTVGVTGMAGGIGLAIDGSGQGWSYDIVDDNFYSVDLATGSASVVGALGFDANFGQGMTWDPNTDTVYLSAFNSGTFQAEWRSADTGTGNTTFLGVLGGTSPGGLNQLAWCGMPDAGGGGGGGGCTAGTFTDRAAFEAAFGGSPINEDFTPAPVPGGIATCTEPINSGGGSCYAAGEIEDGIEIAARDLVDLVSIDAGVFGNSEVMVGPNFFSDAMIVNFPNNDVTAFGADVLMPLAGVPTDINVTVNGVSGVIATLTATATGTGTPAFIGYIAEETIVSIEFEDPLGGGELISLAVFGECTGGGGGGGGNDCSVTGPGNGFENGKSSTWDLGRIVAHDITVPADVDMTLEVVEPHVFIGATGSGVNANFVDVYIYDDAGGQPGAVLTSQLGVTPASQTVVGSNFGFDVWNLELDITDVMLAGTAGSTTTYWVGISVAATDGSNNFWENSTAGLIGFGEAYNDGSGVFVIDSTLEGVYTFTASCEDMEIFTYDDCEGALPISCGDTVQGSTIGATVDTGVAPDCDTATTSPGVWYKWEDTSGLASDVTVTTCSPVTQYDSKISVYTGECSNPPLTCVAGNDDDCGLQSTVNFSSDGNTTFYILVHGFGGATGDFELSLICNLIPPPNDEIQNAIDLDEVGCPFTDEDVAMPAATEENGTPTDCDISGANGVWYVFTPEIDGWITGTISSPAGFSSVTFYTAPDETSTEDELVLVDWWQNQCLPSTTATIPLTAGQTYYSFVVNTGGITDIVFDNCQLGVNANQIDGFVFYPNPTNDRLNLSAPQNIEKVVLYNILGQKVIDQKVDATATQVEVSHLASEVSHLASGAYLMDVFVDGQKGTYKVIKN